MYVQVRQEYPMGESPIRVKVRSPVARIAVCRETEVLKSIDKTINWVVSKYSGRNESERTGSLETTLLEAEPLHTR